MALPKKKTAKSSQGKRRSHLKLGLPAMDVCPHCHSPKLAHCVCPKCGWYNDREAIEVKPSKK
jgi:large subunit ribosomal protein L32